ncbi:fumarylacetoacetase [Saccharomonospora sp. CUA-673]|nr:fumarylacetoacetase [Saccharomonospora sp. CUA-673]
MSNPTRLEIPDGSPFGTDNLPYGVFSTPGSAPRIGVRVGESVVDLAATLGDDVFASPSLNAFMAQGKPRWDEVRERVGALVAGEVPAAAVHAAAAVTLHLPFEVADYVDFYASEHHAANVGRILRPDAEPLLPNWKHLPVGYHGRSSTVVVSGTEITRPCGQKARPDGPVFGPTERLDLEVELGFVVGTGSRMGTRLATADFAEHVFGVVLVNDWSARDIQAWEYQPLGPHLGKSFATSISPWVVPLAALERARVPGPVQDPAVLPYLRDDRDRGLDIDFALRWNGQLVSYPAYRDMYWSPAQMLAHLTAAGAACSTGDLYASGTVSGPTPGERGALIELTWGGRDPVDVAGRPSTFLEDGDEVVISATAPGTGGGRIGLGEVAGRIAAARQ